MDRSRKELLVARICAGCVRIKIGCDGPVLLYQRPTPQQVYIAHEVYFDSLREAELEGLYSDEDLIEFLLRQEFWDEEKEELLKRLPKDIEEFKVQLFKANFRSHERKVVREALRRAKETLDSLFRERHAWDYLSCSGHAASAKAKYLFACSLFTPDGRQVFREDFWDSAGPLLDEAMEAYSRLRLDEAMIRELARTEPWRGIWSAHKIEGRLFGDPLQYTEEQTALVSWSSLYDNVFQHPECPSDFIVEDDDLLDGWMIDQRRQREARMNQQAGESLIQNEKIRNSQEVFLVANTKEDARRVVDMNDAMGKAIQKQRFQYLKEKGTVNELDMPDTRQRLRMEMTQKFMKARKGE